MRDLVDKYNEMVTDSEAHESSDSMTSDGNPTPPNYIQTSSQGKGEAKQAHSDLSTPASSNTQELDMDSDLEPGARPTLVHETVEAIKQKRGHSAAKGRDVLVVLSSADLMRNLLLKSEILQQRIPNFVKKHGISLASASQPQEADHRVKCLLVLTTDSQSRFDMPTLERSGLNTLVTRTKFAGDEQPTAETVKETNIKTETLSNGIHPENISTPPPKEVHKATADWSIAYGIFFRILLSTSSLSVARVGLPKLADAALPLLEGVMAVAKFYDCGPASLAFKTLSYDWITNGTFYPAIAAAPVRWLALAVKLQSELVYKEAFVHVVGLHSQRKVDLDGLPEPVVTLVKERVDEERMKRYEVDEELLLTTIRLQTTSAGAAESTTVMTTKAAPVSQHRHSSVYDTVNLWRDYIADHLSLLKFLAAAPSDGVSTARPTPTCSHPANANGHAKTSTRECLTIADFYRLLAQAGDAYLPADKVEAKWNSEDCGDDFKTIRTYLAVLKKRAKGIVEPLVKSNLFLDERERVGLEYLTCVEVGRLPWGAGFGEGTGEDEGERLDDWEMDGV
ncbi:hypothetical protein KC340_g17648 [Hortaea werneckii]|nr:hypothetical protein KC342_g8055 [Hortaea werneckii]KAI7096935.1 hypothetical protein KC339_g10032 [Hortaea werneckii]KAI7206450.1 hypothetical protein KC365_g17139 [Hortaea werneckii]KAI7289632.1 hypothetical protein KC340_g17648 [Hortaea werneckii]KAI7394882.1 hypothetical protein KC328_g5956 [Hortaea werneckii]